MTVETTIFLLIFLVLSLHLRSVVLTLVPVDSIPFCTISCLVHLQVLDWDLKPDRHQVFGAVAGDYEFSLQI